MKIQDRAHLSGRLALANERAADELETLLDKWVLKHFVKGTSAQALMLLRSSGGLQSLVTWLNSRQSTSDVLAIIRKLDRHNRDVLVSDHQQMIAHVEELAGGLAPVPKPRPAPKPKKRARTSVSAASRR